MQVVTNALGTEGLPEYKVYLCKSVACLGIYLHSTSDVVVASF